VTLYIVFSKKAPHVNQIDTDFNAGLKKIQETRVTNSIMQKYVYDFLDQDDASIKKN
jgi:hypothetical protein